MIPVYLTIILRKRSMNVYAIEWMNDIYILGYDDHFRLMEQITPFTCIQRRAFSVWKAWLGEGGIRVGLEGWVWIAEWKMKTIHRGVSEVCHLLGVVHIPGASWYLVCRVRWEALACVTLKNVMVKSVGLGSNPNSATHHLCLGKSSLVSLNFRFLFCRVR